MSFLDVFSELVVTITTATSEALHDVLNSFSVLSSNPFSFTQILADHKQLMVIGFDSRNHDRDLRALSHNDFEEGHSLKVKISTHT